MQLAPSLAYLPLYGRALQGLLQKQGSEALQAVSPWGCGELFGGALDQWGLQAGGTAWKEQESQQQAPPVAFYSHVCQLHAAKAAV